MKYKKKTKCCGTPLTIREWNGRDEVRCDVCHNDYTGRYCFVCNRVIGDNSKHGCWDKPVNGTPFEEVIKKDI